MWTLGKRKGENALSMTIKEYNGKVLIQFQHYFKIVGEDCWHATKKGVALNLGEWDTFLESLIDIDAKLRQLRCKNEPSPPTGIKKNLQSAFGGEDDWMCEMFVLWMYVYER